MHKVTSPAKQTLNYHFLQAIYVTQLSQTSVLGILSGYVIIIIIIKFFIES